MNNKVWHGKVSAPQRVTKQFHQMQLSSISDDEVNIDEIPNHAKKDIPPSPLILNNNVLENVIKPQRVLRKDQKMQLETSFSDEDENDDYLFTKPDINNESIIQPLNNSILTSISPSPINFSHMTSFKDQAFIYSPSTVVFSSNSHIFTPSLAVTQTTQSKFSHSHTTDSLVLNSKNLNCSSTKPLILNNHIFGNVTKPQRVLKKDQQMQLETSSSDEDENDDYTSTKQDINNESIIQPLKEEFDLCIMPDKEKPLNNSIITSISPSLITSSHMTFSKENMFIHSPTTHSPVINSKSNSTILNCSSTKPLILNNLLFGNVTKPQRVLKKDQQMQLETSSSDEDENDDYSSTKQDINNESIIQPLLKELDPFTMQHKEKPLNNSILTSISPSPINFSHMTSFKDQAFIYSPSTVVFSSNSHIFTPSLAVTQTTQSKFSHSHTTNSFLSSSPTLRNSSRKTQSSFNSLLSLSPPSVLTQPSSSESFSPATNNTDNDEGRQLMIKGITYKVIEEIGKGGFSVVYSGSSKGLKECAIKCIHLQNADSSTIQAYLNEVNILKKLKGSQHVIHLYDDFFDKATQMMYLVMEKGEDDFGNFFKKKSTLDAFAQLALVKKCWTEMLQAVHVIHSKDIVHWDLKPANFVVMKNKLKVIDFGISKQVLPDHTSATCDQIIGTYNYMSPEAFTNLQTDLSSDEVRVKAHKKSDTWSLGCILYSMVYAVTPFQKFRDPIKKMTAIISSTYQIPFPPTSLGPDVVRTMKKCLVRDSKVRASVESLLFDDPFLTNIS